LPSRPSWLVAFQRDYRHKAYSYLYSPLFRSYAAEFWYINQSAQYLQYVLLCDTTMISSEKYIVTYRPVARQHNNIRQ
jgi:hypothetical protein